MKIGDKFVTANVDRFRTTGVATPRIYIDGGTVVTFIEITLGDRKFRTDCGLEFYWALLVHDLGWRKISPLEQLARCAE